MDRIEKMQSKINKLINPCSDFQTMQLKIVGFEEGFLTLRILGACSGCAGAEATFEGEVKGAILRMLPEVEKIELEHSMSEELLDMARSILTKK